MLLRGLFSAKGVQTPLKMGAPGKAGFSREWGERGGRVAFFALLVFKSGENEYGAYTQDTNTEGDKQI